jgi:uncharacterized protein YdaL
MGNQIKTDQTIQIFVLIFFTLLVTSGLVVKGFKDDAGTYIHIEIILLFLTLIINQLSVWRIKREYDSIHFSNFLGISVKILNEKENNKSIKGFISHHPSRDEETGEHLKLITDKGTFSFNSENSLVLIAK